MRVVIPFVNFGFACLTLIMIGAPIIAAQTAITSSTKLSAALKTGEAHRYTLTLTSGESADVVVHQRGIDVVVQLKDPAGKIVDEIDGPTGANGDEIVEIIARESGAYILVVRPFGRREARGAYELEVRTIRNTAETGRLLRERQSARDAATGWLRTMSSAIPGNGRMQPGRVIPVLDTLARNSRAIGLGEATHGSREINDLRFSISRYLVERHGYRVIAIEASTATLELIEPYVNGVVERTPEISYAMESEIWIGKRIRGELYEWARRWNKLHPRDRVQIVGVDPQGSTHPLETLRSFVGQAYGEELLKKWAPIETELAAADQQTYVFGYSGVAPSTRQFVMNIVAMLNIDAPLLRAKFGDEKVEAARNAAQILAEFSDFNSDSSGPINHSRDWYIATRVLRAIGRSAKAVYWAHNAHVAHPSRSSWPAGSVLRQMIGCDYTALAITLGEGAFLAQVMNDPQNRLAVSTLPLAMDESVESMLKKLYPSGSLSMWPCSPSASENRSEPEWLRREHPMHWVGGIYDPANAIPTSPFRPFDILRDFDAIAFLPAVTAEEIPNKLPVVPPRNR